MAHYLGLTPKGVDGTAVAVGSFMIHVRHAAAAIASGLCDTVLITHGESGRPGVGRTRNVVAPTSLAGQFEQPYGPMGPPTLFTIRVLRYMKTYGLTHEQLAMVASCSANGRRRTHAPPSRRRSPSATSRIRGCRSSRPSAWFNFVASGAGGAGTAGFLMINRVPSNLSITPSRASKRSSKVWNSPTFAMQAVAR